MSPSVRSRAAIWPASQSVGKCPSLMTWPKTRAHNNVCVSSVSLRKSGIWQASHSSRTALRPDAISRISGSRDSATSVSWSDASLPLTRPALGGGAVRLSSSASMPEKSSPRRCASTARPAGRSCAPPRPRRPRRTAAGIRWWCRGAVTHAAAGAAGDLRHLGRGEAARAVAVELAQSGEGDVIDVHVEAHSDGVGRHQEVHLPFLIKLDLGVPGARAEAAHHHRATAFAAADEFGDGVDLGGAERDHGGPRRQSHQLRRTGVGELRQPGAGLDRRFRHQAAQSGRMVSAPRNMVSTMPRACSRRSVKTWPRSGSAQSWISSTATNST